jgi:hypothetical protein
MKVPIAVACALVACLASAGAGTEPYVVVGTGQTRCYDASGEIPPPGPGEPFSGQDAQHPGPAPHYADNGDGTVSDLTTGLMWVAARGDKQSWSAAVAGAAACAIGGHHNWRMPGIKELFSLIDFTGSFCGGSGGKPETSRPFIDRGHFGFAYGDPATGVRLIDCQDWSATVYVGTTMRGDHAVFGVNFADGRIKGYPTVFPSGAVDQLFVRYVRGDPDYGRNDFHDNRDGTISDRATGLMWQQGDSGAGMDWEHALAYARGLTLAGHRDWRLPNAKELQSIVDYTRAPAISHSAAISPLFQVTPLDDGDFPYFWTSTTHLDGPPDRQGSAAVYIAFGRATGWMPAGGPGGFAPPWEAGSYTLLDVHGAGAQRSDPKAGDPGEYPYGRGPQGDVIRIRNFVRAVRGGDG